MRYYYLIETREKAEMKIKIIDICYRPGVDALNLKECGFEVGDVVEVSGEYNNGDLSIKVIRETEYVSVGNEVLIRESEYEEVE